MIKFRKAKKESKSDKLRRGTIEVFKEFDEYLKKAEKHRNDGQKIVVKGVFAETV